VSLLYFLPGKLRRLDPPESAYRIEAVRALWFAFGVEAQLHDV